MNIISFLDWLLNSALPMLAPALTISGLVLFVVGIGLWVTDHAHARR